MPLGNRAEKPLIAKRAWHWEGSRNEVPFSNQLSTSHRPGESDMILHLNSQDRCSKSLNIFVQIPSHLQMQPEFNRIYSCLYRNKALPPMAKAHALPERRCLCIATIMYRISSATCITKEFLSLSHALAWCKLQTSLWKYHASTAMQARLPELGTDN